MLTPDDVRLDYLGQIPERDAAHHLLFDDEGNSLVPDTLIQRAIDAQLDRLKYEVDVDLTPTRYACRPELGDTPLVLGDDYDQEVSAYRWKARDSNLIYGTLSLGMAPVLRVNRVRAIYGSTVLFTIPLSWVQLKRRIGQIQFVPDGSGTIEQNEEIANSIIAFQAYLTDYQLSGRGGIPDFWAIDFTAGYANPPKHMEHWIGWNAAAEALSLAAALANKGGVTNQSVSKDGVSRSFSSTAGQPGGRFSAFLSSPPIARYFDDKMVERFRDFVRSTPMVL